MSDKQCEELAFPVLFPKGRFGYKVEREVKLSPVKYFNARLLHCSGRFATNPEYLFMFSCCTNTLYNTTNTVDRANNHESMNLFHP